VLIQINCGAGSAWQENAARGGGVGRALIAERSGFGQYRKQLRDLPGFEFACRRRRVCA
jgi:hypothetical protein